MKKLKKLTELIVVMMCAVLLAINYTIFIFPNSFAPAGIDGFCTMIQDMTNVSMGYLSLLVNVPLLILAYIFLNRDFAVKTAVFVLTMSVSLIVLKSMDISRFYYHTQNGTSLVLAPVVAGVIRGILYAVTLKLNASGGGVDLIAALFKIKKPYLDFMNIIFTLNMTVALCSYFVYDMKLEPVICSIIYSFLTSTTSKRIRTGENENVKFEIITPDCEILCERIINELNLSATVMDAQGAYSKDDAKMVICVTEKNKVPYLENLILEFKNAVVFKSTVSNAVTGIQYK